MTSTSTSPEVIGNSTINRDQATAKQQTLNRDSNTLGINPNHHIIMKKSLADTNNDGQKDAFLIIYENLPKGQTSNQVEGFQINDILVFTTPELKNSID
ncbi:hypothetical protein PG593_08980 [Riemerella anatipestifer]|nr:hypothetical protein [Riemerella anatipestifer]